MLGLFGFLDMAGTYESRKVKRFEDEASGLKVDTCSVTDSPQPYETAVMHPAFNDGKWVIVAQYDTRREAKAGHDLWVKKMTGKRLPKELRDVSTCATAELCDVIGRKGWRKQKRQPAKG